MLFSYDWEEDRDFALTIFFFFSFQHCPGGPIQGNKARKIIKRHIIGNDEHHFFTVRQSDGRCRNTERQDAEIQNNCLVVKTIRPWNN